MTTYASMRKADLIELLTERDAALQAHRIATQTARWEARDHDTRDSLEAAYAALQAQLDKAEAELEAAQESELTAQNNANDYATQAKAAQDDAAAADALRTAAEHVAFAEIGGARVLDVDTSRWYHRVTLELDAPGHGHMIGVGDTLTLAGLAAGDMEHLAQLI